MAAISTKTTDQASTITDGTRLEGIRGKVFLDRYALKAAQGYADRGRRPRAPWPGAPDCRAEPEPPGRGTPARREGRAQPGSRRRGRDRAAGVRPGARRRCRVDPALGRHPGRDGQGA